MSIADNMTPQENNSIYTKVFFLALIYNFFLAFNFTNNAIYPLFVIQSGGTSTNIGLFMAVYSLSAVISRPIVGPFIDRYGSRNTMIVGSLLMSLPAIFYIPAIGEPFPVWVWGLRIIQGFGAGAHFSSFFTLASEVAPEGKRNETIAMYGISGLGANLVAPLMGEWLTETYGLSHFFIMVTSFGVMATLMAFLIKTPLKIASHDVFSPRKAKEAVMTKKMLLPYSLSFAMAVPVAIPLMFLAPFAKDIGLTGFSLFFTGYATTGIIARLIGKRWADQFGWRRMLIPLFLLFAISMILIANSESRQALILAGLFGGIAHALAFPAIIALGYTFAPKEVKGSAIAVLTGTMDLGFFVSGVIFGQVAYLWGYKMLFYGASIIPIMGALGLVIHIIKYPQHFSSDAEEDG
jgi:MFS family permease